LRLLDRYPISLPTKGGHVQFVATTILITSNFAPLDWYKWEGREVQQAALMRRIHSTYEWTMVNGELFSPVL